MNKYIIILVLIFAFDSVNAQSDNLLFHHLTVEDGLSQNTIESIYQDKAGFMWFGTHHGLNKYDGYEFTVYAATGDKPGQMASNSISAIFEDSFGLFWVGTASSGLYLFDREKEWFHLFVDRGGDTNNLRNNRVRAIFEDSDKNLWIGTSGGGLSLFNRVDSSFTSYQYSSHAANCIGSDYICSISEDSFGNLWLGSSTGDLIKFDKQRVAFTNYKLYDNKQTFLHNPNTGVVYVDSDNDIWLGTYGGVFILNQKNNSVTHLQKGNTKYNLNSNAISSILEYKKGVFFISTDHGGLNIYNKKTTVVEYHKATVYDNTTISNNQLYSIYKSPEGIVWIGSFKGGVNILNTGNKFQQYKYILKDQERLLCCKSIISMCDDLDGNIWLGYNGGGIDIFNPLTHEIKHIEASSINNSLKSDIITSLYRDDIGDIWIGHYLDGISHFSWKTKSFSHLFHSTNSDKEAYLNFITCMLQDSDSTYWIGTSGGGLKLYNKYTKEYTVYRRYFDKADISLISSNSIYTIFKDNNGDIWVGTHKGINRFNRLKKDFTRYLTVVYNNTGLKGDRVYDIYQDRQENIWVATDNGLKLYDKEIDDFISISDSNGINSSVIKCILDDELGNLWLSTTNGIVRFNIKERSFRNYDILDGLQGIEFNENSRLKTKDGEFFFGGKNGFNIFYPEDVKDNPNKPPVFFTDFRISNISVSQKDDNSVLKSHINYTKEVLLSYKQSNISFRFAALNYVNTANNKYKYMLEGFDAEWVNSGSVREASYTNLPSGEYVFKVIASNNDGVWNNKEKSILITITPPYWKTTWFLFLEILLLIAFVILIVNFRNKRLLKDKKKLIDTVGIRTKEIEQQSIELQEVNTLLEESKEEVLQQNEALVQHKENLESVVEERTKELIVAKEKAEESDRLKSAFLANMSHEIRTPLNAILGFSVLLNEKELKDDERDEYISIIDSNSESLLLLIDDILDISTIEANQLVLNKEAFFVNDIVSELHSNFVLINKKPDLKILLNNEIEAECIKLFSDRTRIIQILTNLTHNAIKFTAKGFVKIGLSYKNNNLLFYINDTGGGILESDQKKIFQRFRKIEEKSSGLFRGVGLGLSISKRLSELLGAELSVESKLGEGSTFYLSFPLDSIKTNEDVWVSHKKEQTIDSRNKSNILIAEDEPTNYLYLKKLIEKSGLNVIWAKNGREAVDLFLEHNPFDIVLMDIKMPEMDGFEALKLIRENKPNQIVIAQTAYARPEDSFKLKESGFNDFITKPINTNKLFDILNKYL